MDLISFMRLFAFILPAYISNAVPVLFGGGAKIDGGQNFVDGRPLLGKGKTINGLIAGLVFGTLAGIVLAMVFPNDFLPLASGLEAKALVSFLLAAGAMAGDLVGSFIKRRMGMKSGDSSMVMDQLLFLLLALVFSAIVYPLPGLLELAILLVMTFVLHLLSNIAAYALKLKRVPW